MHEIPPSATEVFRFPLAILAIPVVVCVVCAILGILCFRKREARRLSYFFLAAALIAGGLFAPAMFGDRIIVSPQEIATTTGFWFAPTREGFVYQDVLRVRVTTYYDLKNRACPAWEVYYRDGHARLIQLSDLWVQHSNHIIDLLQGYGVAFYK